MADEIARLKVVIDAEDNASAVIDRVSGKVGSVSGVSTQTAKGLKGVTKEVDTAADKWISAGKAINSYGKDLDTITKPMQVAAVGAIAGGVAVSKMAMDYESAFIKVKKTVDGTPEQLARLDEEIKALSDDIPVSSTELAELAAVGGQLGIAVDDVAKFTETMAAIGTATNLQGEDGAATIARFMNVMGEETQNVDRVGSAIVELGNNTATTEAEIATMAQRMGKFGKTVGMSTAQVLGYSAALSSSGIEAQLGGSAIGRTWLNIESAVNSGGKELAAYAKYAGVSASEFKKQWNDSPSGAFNGLIKGLSSVENLTGALAEMGVENIQDQQIVMALANNYELMANALDLSANAYKDNTALMKEAETAYGSTANQIKLALNDIQDAAISWGNVLLPEIRNGAQWVGNVAKSFENMSDAQKKSVVTGAKAAVALGLTTKVASSTIKGVGNTVEAIGNIKKATAAGGALTKFAPTLAKVGAAAGPVALGVGAVTAAVIVGKKVYDDYQNAQLEASRDMLATSKDARDAAKNYTELNKLQKESKELTKKIDSGTIQGEELDSAKARLESIKNILEAEYKINIDQSDIDSALEKAKSIEARTAAQSRNETVQEMNSATSVRQLSTDIAKDSYELRGIETQQTNIVNAQTAIENLRAEWDALDVAQQNNIETQADFKKRLNEAVQSAGIEEFEDYNYAYADFGRALVDLQGKYNDLDAEAQKFRDSLERNEETLSNTKATAANLAHIGLAEMEQGKTNQGLSDIALGVKKGMLDADSYARQAAVIQQSQESLDAVFNQGGQVLDDYVNQYISNMKQFGAGAKETAKGAALIKNGVTDISKVTEQSTFDAISRDATKLARDMGEIPESKSIKINAEGDISVIDDATGKIEQIENKSINVSVTAEGNLEILDLTTGELQTLQEIGAASVQVNANGNIEVLDEAQTKIAEVDGETGTITVNAEYPGAEAIQQAIANKDGLADTSVEIEAKGTYSGKDDVATAISHQNSLKDVSVTYTVTYATIGTPPQNQAKGTQNFGGGLAMVNDQTGISDPRELIIDNGRAFIPQGRNVILPLSKGAKVYTATQTKRMMAALGIPQYAGGKDNSDAFTTARDSWTHTTNIRAVSVSEELEKWVEFSGKFKSNINDANDIQEEIYSLSLKQRDELNEDSEDYILTRARMNDWNAYGDTAVDAFNRVRDREKQYVAEGKVLERDSHKYLEELGSDMFDARVKNSKWWLDHETEYNNLSVEDYMAGLDRMRAYTEEYYKNNIISAEEYYSTLQMLDDMKVDKTREQNDKEYEAWKKSADGWYEQRELYGDWEEFGDSPEQFFARCIQKQDEFFEAGKISWEEYNDAVIDYQMDLYRAHDDEFESILDSFDDYIDHVNDSYDELISKKREAYETKNLKQDLADAQAEKAKYSGAVTQKGKDAYNQAVKDIEEISYEMEINQLEKEQAQTVKALRAEFTEIEKNKKKILKSVSDSGISLEGYSQLISKDSSNIQNVLSQILSVVSAITPVSNNIRYGDVTQNINAGGANIEGMIRYATNAIAG